MLSFIVVFGITKALANYAAGRLADRFGRKQILVAGWLVATPVPRPDVGADLDVDPHAQTGLWVSARA